MWIDFFMTFTLRLLLCVSVGTALLWWQYYVIKKDLERAEQSFDIPILSIDISNKDAFLGFSITATVFTVSWGLSLWRSSTCWNVCRIWLFMYTYIDGLVQDCSNSSALAMELLQSCTKPSLYALSEAGYSQNWDRWNRWVSARKT